MNENRKKIGKSDEKGFNDVDKLKVKWRLKCMEGRNRLY